MCSASSYQEGWWWSNLSWKLMLEFLFGKSLSYLDKNKTSVSRRIYWSGMAEIFQQKPPCISLQVGLAHSQYLAIWINLEHKCGIDFPLSHVTALYGCHTTQGHCRRCTSTMLLSSLGQMEEPQTSCYKLWEVIYQEEKLQCRFYCHKTEWFGPSQWNQTRQFCFNNVKIFCFNWERINKIFPQLVKLSSKNQGLPTPTGEESKPWEVDRGSINQFFC